MDLGWPDRSGKDVRATVGADRRWAWAGVEPTVSELLSDPIAVLLMRADRLTATDVERSLGRARHFLPTYDSLAGSGPRESSP
jgi:hypothetical protein